MMRGDKFNNWLMPPKGENSPRAPLVMGILNVTPDSFSDGGKFAAPDAAACFAEEMTAAGADWIDVGGESTRPGSHPVPPEEQLRRILPVLKLVRDKLPILISIDTTNARVAEAALDAGANLVNDVSAGRDDPNMFPLVARSGVPLILMHRQNAPATMQLNPTYQDVTREVADFLIKRRQAAMEVGIDREKILFDPGLGFGKTVSHNLQLMHDTAKLVNLGQPLVVGPSRKSFLGKITGETDPSDRLFATAAAVAWCIANGAAVVRVHDVGPITKVARTIRAISQPKFAEFLKD
jgi:dihydropteroate synthase